VSMLLTKTVGLEWHLNRLRLQLWWMWWVV
jgi:hypothetical protein